MFRRILLVMALVMIATSADAAEKTGFLEKTFKNADGSESPYVVFVPADYDGTKELPVILFLHGAGETKGGSKMPADQGIGTHIKKVAKTFPFLTIIPQAEDLKTQVVKRWHAGSPDADRALKMLEATMKEYKSDAKRVYLTSLSMGGFGTWSLAAAHPERWAAIVPICGGGNLKDAEKIKDLPTWCFHGDKDNAVKVELSRTMIDAITKSGGKPKYTEYPGVGHNSWDEAYATEELYTWMLSHKSK